MFRLLRYFSISSAIAITVVTVVLLILYRQNAIDDLLRFGEAQNEALTRSLANSFGSIREPYAFVIDCLERQEVGLWTSKVSRCGFRRRAG